MVTSVLEFLIMCTKIQIILVVKESCAAAAAAASAALRKLSTKRSVDHFLQLEVICKRYC